MAVIHVTEAEAAKDLADLLAKVRAGDEVQIAVGKDTLQIIPVQMGKHNNQPRLISEVIASMRLHESNSTLDDQFGNDVKEGIRSHEHERLIDPWESF